MIDIQSQNDLFKLISANLKKDISCYAFGGTAMMYYGYKNATKDIDFLFDSEKDMNEFIAAIESLGYRKRSLAGIYSEEKQTQRGKPIVYTRGDERFDLFLKKIFWIEMLDEMKKRAQARHDFSEKKDFIVYLLSKEDLILLKSVTEREKDFDDILSIIEKEKFIDWKQIVDSVMQQKDKHLILDLEKTMQRLRKHTLIKKEYFDRLYAALD